MLELPRAGHRLARRWWFTAVAAYVVLAGALVGALITNGGASLLSLFGIGERVNWSILVLVGSGIVLTGYAAWRAWRDISTMRREEVDVEWVHQTGKPGLPLVFVDPNKRKEMLGKIKDIPEHEVSIETLMDDRVRRVHNAALDPNAGAIVPDDLKGIAEVRTAQFGSFPRYASSLLLLLAVLGTFAGVKTALPGLIESITTSAGNSSIEANAANQGLIRSLNAVAEAFGGNALALVGAIAVGVMAQGIGFGRRNLLERLELVSAEFLYGQNVTADANPMQAAMVALRDTAREMHSASGAMVGIEDQLQQLGREFKSAFDDLANRMHDIAVGQEEALYAKTAESIEALQQRVSDLTDSVEANARTYAGLAEAVKLRSQEASRAFDAMAESNRQLGTAIESIVKTGERSRSSVDELNVAVAHFKEASTLSTSEIQRVAIATEAVAPAMRQLETTLQAAERRFSESERMSQDGWRQVAAQVSEKLDAALKGIEESKRRVSKQIDGPVRDYVSDEEALRLLSTIATRLDHLRPGPQPIWRSVAGPLVGVAVGFGLVSAISRLF
jgi:hypothetical protein